MLAGDMASSSAPTARASAASPRSPRSSRADLWRLGQVRAGRRVTLCTRPPTDGRDARRRREAPRASAPGSPPARARPDRRRPRPLPLHPPHPPPIFETARDGAGGPLTFRRAGERCLLVEFGEPVLDLRSRVRATSCARRSSDAAPTGLLDLTPGVRSLHVQHDPDRLPAAKLLALLATLEPASRDPTRSPCPAASCTSRSPGASRSR